LVKVEITTILGIDLAWGTRMPDAVARIDYSAAAPDCPLLVGHAYTSGDDELLAHLEQQADADRLLLAIDAPTRCLNEAGSRLVDKECNQHFRKFEAGCHPVNRKLCARPLRLADKLEAAGYDLSWQLGGSTRTAVEVYPHPAMVRWFGLERTIKYKRGPVANKRLEFQRYQQELRAYLEEAWPEMVLPENFQVVLGSLWSKRSEDLLDAYFCALIGLWHIAHAGERTQVLGDLLTGHMIVPMSNEIPPT
jgi:predicted RNase H-like nuclease